METIFSELVLFFIFFALSFPIIYPFAAFLINKKRKKTLPLYKKFFFYYLN